MFTSHFRSWVMKVPRERIDSTLSRVTQGDEGGQDLALPEVHSHLTCFESVELQVIATKPGHQVVSLPARDESDEGGLVRELQEFDGLVTGCAAVCVQEEKQRRKNAASGGIQY